MKNTFFAMLIFATLSAVSLWSCDKTDIGQNPDMPDGTINPTFALSDTEETITVEKEGGVLTFQIDQNTNYKWVATSDEDWAVLDVAITDTLEGDKTLTLTVEGYEAIDPRSARITVQEVLPKVNRTITILVIQRGAEPEVNVDRTNIETEAEGGQYEVVVTTNGGTWTASSDVAWLSVSPATGQNVTAIISAAKNVNPATPTRTGVITFVSGTVSATVTVVQNGYTTCNEPGNTTTIYFDEFAPCEDASVGDVWNLTDRRDGKVYKVKLMADGHYWMIEDLRYGGDTDVVASKNTFSTDNPAQAGTLGEYITGLYGDIVNITFNGSSDINPPRAGRGYFYNWRAAVQQADISVGDGYSETQGIAPAGWHIPSVDEFKDLRTAIGIDGVSWGENAASLWKGIWGGDIDGGTRRNWGLAAYGYYWTSTNSMPVTPPSVAMGNHQAVAWCVNSPTSIRDNVNIFIEGNVAGVAEPVKKNKNGGALIRCVRNY